LGLLAAEFMFVGVTALAAGAPGAGVGAPFSAGLTGAAESPVSEELHPTIHRDAIIVMTGKNFRTFMTVIDFIHSRDRFEVKNRFGAEQDNPALRRI
jgi:hypothetical protein